MFEEFHKACRLGDIETIEKLINLNPEAIQNIDPSLG